MDQVQGAYEAHASQVARQVYLIVGDQELAGQVVNEAFTRAGCTRNGLSRDPGAQRLIRAEALRLLTGPWGRLRTAMQRRDGDAGRGDRSEHATLFRALQALPEHQRIALVLHHVAGLTPDEVAAESESTVGAAIARIERGENELARAITPHGEEFDPGELAARLTTLAEQARVPLLTPHLAAELPARRRRRTITTVVVGAVYLLVVLVAAGALGGGSDAPTESASGEMTTSDAPPPPPPPPSPEPEEPSTPAPTSDPVLPTRESAPDLSAATSNGRDFGFAREAFMHAGTTYLSLDRARLRAGRISNVSTVQRTFALAEDASVVPGARLSGALGGRTIGLEEFLRLVAAGQAGTVPVTIRYDDRGRIQEISEYESR